MHPSIPVENKSIPNKIQKKNSKFELQHVKYLKLVLKTRTFRRYKDTKFMLLI